MNSIIHKLKRELTRSPKKAAALGLLCLVALYFWLPLAYHLIAGNGDKPHDQKSLVLTSSATPAELSGVPKAAAGSDLTWQQLAKAIESDRLMSPVETFTLTRDPFQPPRTTVAEADPAAAVKMQPVITPEDVKLVLSSTIVGPRSSIAVINGKTFRQGDLIKAEAENAEVSFRILEIHRRLIVLEREGRKFELKIPLKLEGTDALRIDDAAAQIEPDHSLRSGSGDPFVTPQRPSRNNLLTH